MRCIRFTDLFQGEYVGQRVHPRPAILLGDFNPHKAHFAHFPDGFLWKFPAFIELSRDGNDLVLGKIARRIAEHFMLLTQRKYSQISHYASKRVISRDYTLYFPLIK